MSELICKDKWVGGHLAPVDCSWHGISLQNHRFPIYKTKPNNEINKYIQIMKLINISSKYTLEWLGVPTDVFRKTHTAKLTPCIGNIVL